MVRKYESTAVRQRQIIDAARKLIIKYGSEHVTVKRIAKVVGISETAVYRHFKNKRDILSLLVDHIEDSLVGDITRATAEGHAPSLEILNSVLTSHLSAIEQRRGISFQVIAEIISLGDKKLNRKITETINKYISRLQDLLTVGIKTGEVREDIDPEAAAIVLFGIIQGLVNIWALSNYSFDPQEKYVPLWHIFCEAVVKR
ncbi:MAG: hypothetical protein CO103_07860 [Chloroflexi bacterium CG_4_9_14_3_um_filter_45_9]|nr:MAG: hypothetical protein AUK00_02155 [Dehalococcoidia bacterium CG2_30_46_9]PIU23070.1 MAG: hypothetical protein COT13_05040 [Chloroflexi bacterium CG08_land_8_20_14_0_20_45_12]PJB48002.1 MAG: hypothetical protein CO103_07860 [Chloroflexi bacterium CG_4_9_14_3_um_filter_45_9]